MKNLEVPINSVSFGQTSINILQEAFMNGDSSCIFPIGGNVDISAFDALDDSFKMWLSNGINNSLKSYSRKNPVFKLWHINGSQSKMADKQVLFTFHETDSLTEQEINTLKNQDAVLVSSKYTKKIFENHGVENVSFCPLGIDKKHIYKTNKQYLPKEVTVWGLYGKLENRKHHAKVIQAWASVYGNNKDHVLHAAVTNPFMKPEDQNAIINNILQGRKFFNINFVPFTKTNTAYNDVLNASNIVIATSGGEGQDLPLLQSLYLEKHAVVLKAHVYLDYTNDETVTYVHPNSKIPVYDNMFFHQGAPFNQGNIYDFDVQDLIKAFSIAEKKYKENPVNKKASEYIESYNYTNTYKFISEKLNSI
jgi:hypothetical protein